MIQGLLYFCSAFCEVTCVVVELPLVCGYTARHFLLWLITVILGIIMKKYYHSALLLYINYNCVKFQIPPSTQFSLKGVQSFCFTYLYINHNLYEQDIVYKFKIIKHILLMENGYLRHYNSDRYLIPSYINVVFPSVEISGIGRE